MVTSQIGPTSWKVDGGSAFEAALMFGQSLSKESVDERRGDERMSVK